MPKSLFVTVRATEAFVIEHGIAGCRGRLGQVVFIVDYIVQIGSPDGSLWQWLRRFIIFKARGDIVALTQASGTKLRSPPE